MKIKLTQTYDAIIYDGHNKTEIEKYINKSIYTELLDKPQTSQSKIRIYFRDCWFRTQYISKGDAVLKQDYDQIIILKPEEYEPAIPITEEEKDQNLIEYIQKNYVILPDPEAL